MLPKLFLLDIDRTITNSLGQISQRTKWAIANLINNGMAVSLCTGRHLATTQEELLAIFPQNNYHIFSSGALVANNLGEILASNMIASDVVRLVYQTVDSLGGAFFFTQGKKRFVNQKSWARSAKYGTADLFIPSNNKKDWQTPAIGVIDLNQEICNFIDNFSQLSAKKLTNYQGEEYYELTAVGVSKIWGAEQLATHLKIDLSQIVAIGDSENDLEVVETVGRGVAMGNAVEALKSVASEVIDHIDQDGLAKYLEKYL